MTGISTPSSRSLTPLSFCFSFTILIPPPSLPLSYCSFLPAPQHCSLMFTYSLIQNNSLKLYSLQPLCSFSLSPLSPFSHLSLQSSRLCFFLLSLVFLCEHAQEKAAICRRNEMTQSNWHCWQVMM